jgi:hypothetical protein
MTPYRGQTCVASPAVSLYDIHLFHSSDTEANSQKQKNKTQKIGLDNLPVRRRVGVVRHKQGQAPQRLTERGFIRAFLGCAEQAPRTTAVRQYRAATRPISIRSRLGD